MHRRLLCCLVALIAVADCGTKLRLVDCHGVLHTHKLGFHRSSSLADAISTVGGRFGLPTAEHVHLTLTHNGILLNSLQALQAAPEATVVVRCAAAVSARDHHQQQPAPTVRAGSPPAVYRSLNEQHGSASALSKAARSFFDRKDCAPLLGRPSAGSAADLGTCGLMSGDLNSAYHELSQASIESPEDPHMHYRAAIAHKRLGLHQTAELSLIEAIRLRGPPVDPEMAEELASMILERQHRQAAEMPMLAAGLAPSVVGLCERNQFTCNTGITASGASTGEQRIMRDGVELELHHREQFSEEGRVVPAAKVLAEDKWTVLAAGLGHEMAARRLPMEGYYIASLSNVVLAAGGLLCNSSIVVSTSRLRRPAASAPIDNVCLRAESVGVRSVGKAVLLLERWGAMWQHFMQDLSFKLVTLRELLLSDPAIMLVLEATPQPNVQQMVQRILGPTFDLQRRVLLVDSGCLTGGKPYCLEYFQFDQVYFSEVNPVGWIMSQVPRALGSKLQLVLAPPKVEQDTWLVLTRTEGKTRAMRNLEQVVQLLQKMAPRGIQVVATTADQMSLGQLSSVVNRCQLIVTPHGGQGYNVAMAQAGTVMIEMVPAIRTHDGPYTIHSYAASFNLDYWLLPVDGASHRDDGPMQVPLKKLHAILVQIIQGWAKQDAAVHPG